MSTAANNADLGVGSENKNQGSRNMQIVVVGKERLSCDQIGNGTMMLNQHVTCAISRRTWVDSDWLSNLDEILQVYVDALCQLG
jgi:hypothetical protein